MNIIFCAYRQWSINVIEKIKNHNNINSFKVFNSQDIFLKSIKKKNDNIDFIILLGWSWIIPADVISEYNCIGIHPSDLPKFRGGSPIQNQIIQGVVNTKISLISIGDKIDGGNIIMKEKINFEGDKMEDIFLNIEKSCIKILNKFFDKKGKFNSVKQNISEGSYHKRRNPKQSRLSIADFENKSLLELYNFIRCLTDPYPNAFLEDENGNKLYFKEVSYLKNNKKCKKKS